jgi:hypothetical protein
VKTVASASEIFDGQRRIGRLRPARPAWISCSAAIWDFTRENSHIMPSNFVCKISPAVIIAMWIFPEAGEKKQVPKD